MSMMSKSVGFPHSMSEPAGFSYTCKYSCTVGDKGFVMVCVVGDYMKPIGLGSCHCGSNKEVSSGCCSHKLTHTWTRTTRTQTHTHTSTRILCTHTQADIHTHKYVRTHTQMINMYTHKHVHTQTHRHTHIYIYITKDFL